VYAIGYIRLSKYIKRTTRSQGIGRRYNICPPVKRKQSEGTNTSESERYGFGSRYSISNVDFIQNELLVPWQPT